MSNYCQFSSVHSPAWRARNARPDLRKPPTRKPKISLPRNPGPRRHLFFLTCRPKLLFFLTCRPKLHRVPRQRDLRPKRTLSYHVCPVVFHARAKRTRRAKRPRPERVRAAVVVHRCVHGECRLHARWQRARASAARARADRSHAERRGPHRPRRGQDCVRALPSRAEGVGGLPAAVL